LRAVAARHALFGSFGKDLAWRRRRDRRGNHPARRRGGFIAQRSFRLGLGDYGDSALNSVLSALRRDARWNQKESASCLVAERLDQRVVKLKPFQDIKRAF
jgi:hypothetical protein